MSCSSVQWLLVCDCSWYARTIPRLGFKCSADHFDSPIPFVWAFPSHSSNHIIWARGQRPSCQDNRKGPRRTGASAGRRRTLCSAGRAASRPPTGPESPPGSERVGCGVRGKGGGWTHSGNSGDEQMGHAHSRTGGTAWEGRANRRKTTLQIGNVHAATARQQQKGLGDGNRVVEGGEGKRRRWCRERGKLHRQEMPAWA